MEKVFVITETYVFEDGIYVKTSCYSTMEKAKDAFKFIVNREKKDTWINTWDKDELNVEECETYYNVFVDGRALEYETTIKIEEKEIW